MKGYIQNFAKYRFLLADLTSRDLKVKYRRSVLGLMWSILNPLLMMLIITTVFQYIIRIQPDNNAPPTLFNKDFAIYYLTGSLIFNFVSEATSSALSSVVGNASLIKKVYIPKYIFPLEKTMFSFVNMLFSLIALVIMLIAHADKTPLTWTALLFPIPLIYTFVFCVGFGLILATMDTFFRDTGHLYGVWVTAWVYLTPIIYPINYLPWKMQQVMMWNPLYHYITYFRNVVAEGVVPDLNANLICIAFSLAFLLLGIFVFKRKQDKFILFI